MTMKASNQLPLSSAAMATAMLLVLWTSPPRNALAAKANAKSSQLEADVRQLVEQNCGKCHNSARETAKPAALKVFDLVEDDWTASMSSEQLPKVIGRLKGVDLAPGKLRQAEEFIKGKLDERAALKR